MTMTVFGKDVKCHKSFNVPRSGCGISEILHYSTDVVEQVLKEDSEKAFSAICANNGLLEFFVMASKYITMFVDVCEEDGFRPHILHGKRFAGIPGRTESLDGKIRAVAGLVDEIACYGVGASSLELSADETDASVRYRVRAGAEVSFGIDVMKENGLVYLHLPGTIDIGSFLAHGM